MTHDVGMSVGVFTVDRELVVRSWDPWLAEATGLSPADACGRPLVELFPDVARRGMLERLRRVCDHGAVEVLAPAFHHYLIPCTPRRASSQFDRMQQHVTMSPLRAGHYIDGVVITIEDVTARVEREHQLAAELRSHDEAVRRRAAVTLAQEGHTSVLADALGDESWRTRRNAAQGLAMGGEDAVSLLVKTVRERHRDIAALNAAISALANARADALPAVAELLRGPDADVRTYAALTLGLLRDRRAVSVLLGALKDPDSNVRYHAIEALGRLGAPEAADVLADIAESRDFALAFVALDALSAIGNPLVEPRLLPLLDDEMLGAAAAESLGRIGSEEVVAPLAAALSRDQVPAASVALALAAIHARLETTYGIGALVVDLARSTIDADGARRLVEAVPGASDDELEALAIVLTWIPFDGVDDILASLLAHARVRVLVAEALAGRGDRAVTALLRALRHDDREVRQAAAAALGRAGSRRAVGLLIESLGRDPDEAIAAAAALGGIGDPAAFEPLLALFDHRDPATRQAAVAALNSLAHPDTHARVAAMLADPSPRRRECAARVSGYFGFADCLDAMLALGDDPEPLVRRAALEHIVFFDDPRVAGRLDAALRHDDPQTRAAAARALANLDGPPTAVRDLLLRCLADRDLWVRYFAARSVARRLSGEPEVVAALLRLAESDPVPPVRVAAAQSLGALAAADALPVLLRLTVDPNVDVANAAITALGGYADDRAGRRLLQIAGDDDPDRALLALDALQRRPLPGAAEGAARLASSRDPRVRALALRLLARIGTDDAIAALVSVTAAPGSRAAAVAALSTLADFPAPLVRGLSHPDARVRHALVEAIARTKNPRATRLLVGALHDVSPHVRFEAMRALGRMTLGDVDRELVVEAEDDDNAAVRLVASNRLSA